MSGVLLCLMGRHDWHWECYYAQRDLCNRPNPPMVHRCTRCRAVKEKPNL